MPPFCRHSHFEINDESVWNIASSPKYLVSTPAIREAYCLRQFCLHLAVVFPTNLPQDIV